MRFIRIEGVEGLVFEPEDKGAPKKHPCPDCFFCQHCSDTRCMLCRAGKSAKEAPSDQEGLNTIHPEEPRD